MKSIGYYNVSYRLQKIPSLPLPELREAVSEYLEWVKPLVAPDLYQATEKISREFTKSNGVGDFLHNQLSSHQQDIHQQGDGNLSWLKPFWNEMYLSYRGELVSNMNYFIGLENKKHFDKLTTPHIAAVCISTFADIYFSILDKTLQSKLSEKDSYCTEQYDSIFKQVRIPKKDKDVIKCGVKSRRNNHCILSFRNRLYKIKISSQDGEIYSSEMIHHAVESIFISSPDKASSNLGVFTTAKRDKAASVYEQLLNDNHNKHILETIESAIAFICIDDSSSDETEWLRSLLLSSGNNRYFDKSVQCIISLDGKVGFNMEHTVTDGVTNFVVVEMVHDALVKQAKLTEATSVANQQFRITDDSKVIVKELNWILPKELSSEFRRLKQQHELFSKSIFLTTAQFSGIGKDYAKSVGISPDAIFHMALQLAQYRVFGILKSTYEAVSMQHYRQGRTECARPLNRYLKHLVMEFDNNIEPDQKERLVFDAANAHVQRLKQCKEGKGIERYLLTLHHIFNANPTIPDADIAKLFFENEAYSALVESFLSTSTVGSGNKIKWFGFGPVIKDGYGIAYALQADQLKLLVTSDTRNKKHTLALIPAIKNAVIDIVTAVSN